MGLLDELEKNDKRGLFKSDDHFVNYSTGFLPLDYANGFWADIYSDGPDKPPTKVPVVGIIGGTFTAVIGNTGTGKTTLADQIGYNIIRSFEDGLMFHVDAERTLLRQRLIQITGTNMADERIKLVKEHANIDDVLTTIDQICDAKENGGDLYKYDVNNRSWDGKTFRHYIPTVFVIDSLPSFNAKEFNTKDLGNNMDNARGAKDISRFYNNCLEHMMHYNITIITVNHIRPKVETDKYKPQPRGVMMLGPAETLVRGYVSQFLSQNYFRLNTIKSNIYKSEDVGFEGMKGSLQIAKSKTNFIGAELDMAFNKDIGYDPIFTLFEFASSIGIIEGRNPYLRFVGLDQFRFSRKDFRNKFIDDSEFRAAVFATLTPYLEALLGVKDVTETDRQEFGSLMDEQEKMYEEALSMVDKVK